MIGVAPRKKKYLGKYHKNTTKNTIDSGIFNMDK